MRHFKSIGASDGSLSELIYENATVEEIASAIEQSMSTDRYIIKTGELGNHTYVKGNRVLRLLLGAFYKYFEYNINVRQLEENLVMATVRKTTTGMSGGVIGVNQVKKELKRLEGVLQNI